MKTKYSLYVTITVVLLSILIIQFGCKKNNNNPVPVKKKMVWVVGYPDSTNYGTTLFSADGGDKWVRQGEGSKALLGANINDVWAVDENTVGLLVKTTSS